MMFCLNRLDNILFNDLKSKSCHPFGVEFVLWRLFTILSSTIISSLRDCKETIVEKSIEPRRGVMIVETIIEKSIKTPKG